MRQLLPLPCAQSLGDVSIRLVLSIPPQCGSNSPIPSSPDVSKPSCHCPQALHSSSDRGMGMGELHSQVRYKICGALFLPRRSPGHFPVVLLLPHTSLLPHLQTFSCAGCEDHPCSSKEHLQDFSVGSEPRGNGKCSLGSSCLYFKAPVEWDWDFCQSLARGKVFSGSVHTTKISLSFPPLCFILIAF